MRTVVNIKAGGRTPISGALHAPALLSVVLGAGPSVREMLVKQGVLRLVDPENRYERRIDALCDAIRLVATAA